MAKGSCPAGESATAGDWLPPNEFREQVALVTGGGTGLGLEISRGLAARGAAVVVLSRNAGHHRAFLDEGERRGWRVEARALDVREAPAVQRTAAEVLKTHGKVDILVNNAAGNFVCPSERLSANAWRAVLGIVLDGTFYCSRDFGRAMIARGSGQILNVVATYAWTGMPGVAHSASAKAGVLTLTKTLAAEWAPHGIRVNAIAPGPFESEGSAANLWPSAEARAAMQAQIPLGRFASAAEIARHCLYLLSSLSGWVTGACLTVDGGGSLPPPMWAPGKRVVREGT
jgi:NAD(P)-dependent dehydrogenase (short-subunit alcohol dehydrogenase family)